MSPHSRPVPLLNITYPISTHLLLASLFRCVPLLVPHPHPVHHPGTSQLSRPCSNLTFARSLESTPWFHVFLPFLIQIPAQKLSLLELAPSSYGLPKNFACNCMKTLNILRCKYCLYVSFWLYCIFILVEYIFCSFL